MCFNQGLASLKPNTQYPSKRCYINKKWEAKCTENDCRSWRYSNLCNDECQFFEANWEWCPTVLGYEVDLTTKYLLYKEMWDGS